MPLSGGKLYAGLFIEFFAVAAAVAMVNLHQQFDQLVLLTVFGFGFSIVGMLIAAVAAIR